eukprot:6637286-Alexandrium_andersonii.AAC.1
MRCATPAFSKFPARQTQFRTPTCCAGATHVVQWLSRGLVNVALEARDVVAELPPEVAAFDHEEVEDAVVELLGRVATLVLLLGARGEG